MPQEQLQIKDRRSIAWISEDGSAADLLQDMAGLRSMAQNDNIYNKVVTARPDIEEAELQYVPDDIVCYSNLTAGQFLHGMAMSCREPDMAEAEAVRLLTLFNIDAGEPLLDMTFEGNRLVAVIQALIAKPEVLLLNEPHDMIGDECYYLLLRELAQFYKQGGTVMIAAHAYDDIIFPCEQYIYLRDGQVVANYMRNELIRPAKMITMTGGNTAWMDSSKMVVLHRNAKQIRFIYKETNMQEMAVRLCKTGCKDFTVEDITREELIFENFERWSL